MKLYQVSYHISPSRDTLGELYSSEEEAIKERDFMKYNYKLVFNDPSNMNNFIINTYKYVLQREDWFKAFDFMKKKECFICLYWQLLLYR